MQVEIGLAVLHGEITGDGGEFVVDAVVTVLYVLLLLGAEDAERDIVARAYAADGGEAYPLASGEIEQGGANLFTLVETCDDLVSKSAVFHWFLLFSRALRRPGWNRRA